MCNAQNVERVKSCTLQNIMCAMLKNAGRVKNCTLQNIKCAMLEMATFASLLKGFRVAHSKHYVYNFRNGDICLSTKRVELHITKHVCSVRNGNILPQC